MITSPVSTWEGASAYFTFADNPTVIMILLAASAVVVLGSMIVGAMHESESYHRVKNRK